MTRRRAKALLLCTEWDNGCLFQIRSCGICLGFDEGPGQVFFLGASSSELPLVPQAGVVACGLTCVPLQVGSTNMVMELSSLLETMLDKEACFLYHEG